MGTKKTFLILASVAVEAEVEADGESAELELAANKVVDAMSEAFRSEPDPLGFQVAWSIELDPAEMNCGRCAECGCWVSDREKPESEPGLEAGAVVEGRLLCAQHLPRGHEWAM